MTRVGTIESREAIIEAVKALEIPIGELIVIGGAAMQLFKLKETRDIDVVVPPHRLAKLMTEYDELFPDDEQALYPPNRYDKYRLSHRDGQLVLRHLNVGAPLTGPASAKQHGDITFMAEPANFLYEYSFEELLDEAVPCNDVFISPPRRILDWKLAIDRLDDLQDIAILQAYLNP